MTYKFPVLKSVCPCDLQIPMVLIHTAGDDEKWSRSPYWIFCPRLITLIHKIESSGWIRIFQSWIEGPARKNWENFLVRVPRLLENNLDTKTFHALQKENRAWIGGVQNPFHVKCLHAHFAFFLVHKEGLIGKMVEGLLNLKLRQNPLPANELQCKDGIAKCREDL